MLFWGLFVVVGGGGVGVDLIGVVVFEIGGCGWIIGGVDIVVLIIYNRYE